MTHYQNKSFEIYSSKTTHSTVERTGINTRSSKLKQAVSHPMNTTATDTRRTTTDVATVSEPKSIPEEPQHVSKDLEEPWMQCCTIHQIGQLHKMIYPYIEQIISQDVYYEHPFSNQWYKLKMQTSKTPMTDDIIWKSLKHCLSFDEISHYKDHILSCSIIANFIHLTKHA